MTTSLLDVQDLQRHYKRGRGHQPTKAVDGVSLTIEAGSILGIVGESGCGKSTLARMIMGFDTPSSGHVLFQGRDVHRSPRSTLRDIRRGLQIVFQDPQGSLDPRQTVGTIVAEPLYLDPDAPRGKARRDLVGDVLASVGLRPEDADRRPHEFSGGQRQRIAIARAVISRPKLIIADEPVSALDLSVQAQVLNLIMDLRDRHGIAFLFITHSLAVVETIADRIGVMYRGRIAEIGPTADVMRRPKHPYTVSLLAAEPRIDQPRIRPGERPLSAIPSSAISASGGREKPACRYLPSCSLAIGQCVNEVPHLHATGKSHLVACHLAPAE
jgi:oligopeptide/dipeptide ABC transporter ATP-binding protein